MSEQEFELYLKLLSRCLNLTPSQREQIADELRDHLEQRLEELAEAGVPREKAVVQALDEFGDAAVLAGNFATVARFKRRRFLMRLSLGSVGVLTAVLLLAFAFWPENRAVRGPERVVAQERPSPGPSSAQKQAKAGASSPQQPSGRGGRFAELATPPVVDVCRPVVKEVTDYQIFQGAVQPSQLVQIGSQATGHLRKINFRPGQVVKSGDLLFEINPAAYQVDVDKAKAEVMLAEAKLKLALTKSSRVKQLNELGNTQRGYVNESEDECRVAQAEVQIARATLERAQLRIASTRVTAPINGYISRPSFDVGSLVKAEQSALATIVCLDPVYVSIPMDESTWFALRKRIERGEFQNSEVPVEVAVPEAGDLKRKGFLEFIEDAVFNSGATMMRVRVPNKDAALLAGLFVLVRYDEGNPHRALLVPGKAISGSNVWVVNDQNTVEPRGIRMTQSVHERGLREITGGLKADEWIVCDPSHAPEFTEVKRIEPKRVP
jgi:multidrug efflux system membrane fusion protein